MALIPLEIHEIRSLITNLSHNFGMTIFLSSHLLNEVEQIATMIGIIKEGQLVFQGTQEEIHSKFPEQVIFKLDNLNEAEKIIKADGRTPKLIRETHKMTISIDGKADAANLSRKLINGGVTIHEMSTKRPSLEDLFLEITDKKGENQ